MSTRHHLRAALLCCALALLALPGCEKSGASGSDKQGGGASKGPRKFQVRTVSVGTQPVTYEISTIGTLVEENNYQIAAQVAGVVMGVGFGEGDTVTSGQELCRIDHERYVLLVEQARKELAEQEAAVSRYEVDLADSQRKTSTTVETARVDFELAESEYRRSNKLKAGDYISTEEGQTVEAKYRRASAVYRDALAAAQTEVAVAVAALNQQRAILESRRVELAVAEEDLRKSVVRAPITGVVQSREVSNGDYLTAGKPVARMVQIDPLRLRFTIPESRMSKVTPDMNVKFFVSAHEGKSFSAKVYAIGSISDPDSHEVQCWARLPNPEGLLRPGYFAQVRLTVESRSDAIVVPLGAVQPSEAGFITYVVEDGLAQRRQVQPGLNVTGDSVEITSGLKAGDQLVVEGVDALQDKVPVQVVKGAGVAPRGDQPATTASADGKPETTATGKQRLGSD